ncbi:hypothetical protein GB931_05745 [Modestobacter sp. I12A-02628]|uniref:Uncharacterized protein n=1 Tax=Goekera deserti TaxID=2497753 RepID=A0A7K3WD62_9ACTN|nr:hypothetical protein [Goekera deserti]MPQ97437.1 hypothetical protein [Goekera deserti]NDI47962.1 hypothetical protein [Goekera deserti]NEL53710.1 hypothetical protein [Goekera deserti]
MTSGGLLFAASWQRWAGACPWAGDHETPACATRMDHLYDFLPPTEPWAPAGEAAQLAGASLLVLAVAVLLLPWALTGRKPGPVVTGLLLATAAITVDVGLATLRSGLDGAVVGPLVPGVGSWLWLLAPPVLFGHLAVSAGGRATRAAAVLLLLATPLVAFSTYAIGPWDARPWWEAVSGLLTCAAGASVLVAVARRPAPRPVAPAEPALAR